MLKPISRQVISWSRKASALRLIPHQPLRFARGRPARLFDCSILRPP
ncbi:MAG: hypothetical protein MZV70_68810 [Desulfobacterales bacterium]|nr:hypothetical protein [Desulfobacterales bacterium]